MDMIREKIRDIFRWTNPDITCWEMIEKQTEALVELFNRKVYILMADGDGTTRSRPEPFGVAVNSKEEAERFVKEGNVGWNQTYSEIKVFDNFESGVK